MTEPIDHSRTRSEAYLTALCRRTFLRLWSFPNLYRDQGRDQTGDGKELCDLLVIFGDDVFIFSDKDCQIDLEGSPPVTWARWYKQAVLKSAKQASGAERWLSKHPDRVYVDPACTQRLPLDLPSNPRFHRILTCRGAGVASHAVFGGEGSLFVTNAPLEACLSKPLRVGARDDKGRIYHVIDEASLDALLETFDTACDLVDYLKAREECLSRYDSFVAESEASLIGFYLFNFSDDAQRHTLRFGDAPESGSVVLDESFWRRWLESKQRVAKASADEVSYYWDYLVEKFVFHALGGTEYFPAESSMRDRELGFRWMARESRLRRRVLARSMLEALEMVQPGQLRRRLVPPMAAGDPAWVLLAMPRPENVPHEKYRETRRVLLTELAWVAKLLHPECQFVMGLAVQNDANEQSEDAICLDARDWGDAEHDVAREIQGLRRCFTTEIQHRGREYAYPIDENEVDS